MCMHECTICMKLVVAIEFINSNREESNRAMFPFFEDDYLYSKSPHDMISKMFLLRICFRNVYNSIGYNIF